jgi:sugar lactone lactonase YvrE
MPTASSAGSASSELHTHQCLRSLLASFSSTGNKGRRNRLQHCSGAALSLAFFLAILALASGTPAAAQSTTADVVYGQMGSFTGGAGNNGGVSAKSLHDPDGIAVDSSGNLYVADQQNSRVLYYPAGSTTATRVYGQMGSFTGGAGNNGGISANSLSAPYGLALDSSGDLYVADFGNYRVLYYPSGSTTATRVYGQGGSFTTNTANNGGISANSLNLPIAVVLDSNGNLYVADQSNNRVLFYPSGSTTATQVYGQAGSFTTKTSDNGGVTANSLSFPNGVALDSSGNLYVADGTNSRVLFYLSGSTTATRVYGQGGSFTTATANNGGISADSLDQPWAVALDSSGNFYATDLLNNRVLIYPPTTTPGIYAPVSQSTLTGNPVTFWWAGYPGATNYWLDLGSTQGGNNYSQSGSLSASTFTQTVNSLPSDGSTVYATWWYLLNGTWVPNAYTYNAFGVSSEKGTITSPAPTSTLTASSATFNWTAGTLATAYWIDAGSSPGGTQYFQSGNLGNVLTKTVSGLPTNGSTVYVTLYSLLSGQWLSTAYTYTAYNLASSGGVMQTPMPGAILTGSSVTFNWTAGAGASAYWLDVGSTAGGNQYSQSGNLGNVLTTTVNTLPTDGSPVYVTLYSLIGGSWTANAYTYTALNATGGLAAMQTPTPGTMLSGNAATFTWSPDTNATAYWLDIGSSVGGNQYYQSGNLGTALTTTVNSLPANSSTIDVTLYSLVGGQWLNIQYTYVSGP